MPPKVEPFLKRREITLAQIKKIVDYAEKISETSDVISVKARLDNLQSLMKSFSSVEDEIFARDAEAESLALECDELYYSASTKLNTRIREIQQTIQTENISMTINNGNTSETFNHPRSDTKLPRLTLPTFDGNYQEWQSFHDMFMSAVHDNPVLTGVQKLQYLKGALRGEASASLRHLAITEVNYIEAYQRLVKRYSKKKLILSSFIKTFVNQPTITNTSAKQLRQLCDTSDEIIRGIKALGNGAEGRDSWLIYLVLNKLDEDTQQRWSDESTDVEYPSWQSFLDFITKRADSLESCQPTPKKPQPRSSNIRSLNVAIKNCPLCDTVHNLYECSKFKAMNVNERREFMQGASRCYNCLCDSHLVSRCRSKNSCMKCQKRHNTLLHLPFNQTVISEQIKDNKINATKADSTTSTLLTSSTIQAYQSKPSTFSMGLLQTALVKVRGANNVLYSCRALLDSGSLVSFITESCAQKLGLPRKNCRTIVEGLSSTRVGVSRGRVNMEVFSRSRPETSFNIEALVLSSITSNQPSINLTNHHWEEFKTLPLADPMFHESGNIDILIGCDHYLSLILPGQIRSVKNNLTAQETILGWVISGTLSDREQSKVTTLCTSINIDKALTKFWEIEDIQTPTPHTQHEIYVENDFVKSYQRNSDGRYVVALPFDPEAAPLEESKSQAMRRLQAVERRLARNSELKKEYVDFMREYQHLGHMELIPNSEKDIPWNQSYYLPHHSVYKETSTTTKLRVVFDASAKTNSGRSLNDNLLVGPTIQQTLQQILLRFRFHRYVMTADLEKMFRQILITKPHAEFQRILWREEPTESIREFRLLTVTYGTASAPFLSTRVLKQIANDNQKTFPISSTIIGRDFYVDDLMTGADTKEQLNTLKTEISQIMKASGFNLRKWLSNCPLNDEISIDNKNLIESVRESQYSKVLGMYWNTTSDYFTYRVSLNETPTLTKRGMLSEASKLFDPQGWLAPITIYVKIIFQRTWAKCLDWDDPLPKDISDDWSNFRSELKFIESINIPRWLKFTNNPITLHGFSDASQNAYAAVVYVACTNELGEIEVTIVSAKTKVAPIQKQITIPKLELCAAVLLSNLMKTIQEIVDRETNVYMWTDSSIVLSWIETMPRSLDVFVGNRISQIITNYPRNYWHHITTNYNPADCASRGILPSDLLNHKLWWTGPEWLKQPVSEWPVKFQPTETVTCNLTSYPSPIQLIVSKFSNYNRIIRVLAYCNRYVKNCKLKAKERQTTFLNCTELNASKELLIKYVQENHFHTEIKALRSNVQLPKTHNLINLNPFLDKNGILRVGGRIARATIPFDVKHPILLPTNNVVTEALVRTTHEALLCGNHSLLFTTLKQHYWIINCKIVIRRIIKKCMKCFRYTSKNIQPIMANLPPSRVTLVRPFFSTGVDYAGPIYVRPSKRRGLKPDKSYIAVFVCLSTKAIHLELAGDLSTDTFIAAFRRFISRRGLCREIISDNGSNFIGAKTNLNELFNIVKDTKISNFLSQNQTIWKFNPPTGSHFGGIYEAAVKSTKYHLRRTLTGALLTYEEMPTLLTQIEAILNSRPLCVNTDDDLNPLTPAHFLIGHPYTYLPDPDTSHIKLNHLSRWQYLQRLRQEFWKKWHLTYLTSLQKRTKWQTNSSVIKINDIVILRDDNSPPNKWNLGRVIAVHPGEDSIVRVVTVKTSSGILRRPVVKLSLLPIDE